MCVAGAINNYTAQLQNYKNPSNTCKRLIIAIKFYDTYLCSWLDLLTEFWIYIDNLTESLMFLAHFVGDIHQPLHAGFEADEGGNTKIVHWYRRKSNLHHVKKLPHTHPLAMVQFCDSTILDTNFVTMQGMGCEYHWDRDERLLR